jgi:ATP-binding cassette subfamily D (ALD) long-chain fatty acid import protein
MAEEGIIKWLWGALGLGICAIPVFGGEVLGLAGGAGTLGTRTEGESAWKRERNEAD